MRTKSLLIAAAALAAGIISSQAQPVYSQNIVGYVNSVLPVGYSVIANPLDNVAGNSITNLIPNPNSNPSNISLGSGPFDGSYVYIWAGHSFTTWTLDSTLPTGVGDPTDSYATNAPLLNPGVSFFFDNNSAATTNTFVGTVHFDSGSYPGSSTNYIAANQVFSYVAPKIPVAGGLSTVCGLTNVVTSNGGALDGTYVEFLNVQNGLPHGYTEYTIDSGFPSGYADATDQTNEPEPQIQVGGGFLLYNAQGYTINWVQTLGQ